MNNEDFRAIKHAVAAGMTAYFAQSGSPLAPHCPHCGTAWTWEQQRGYSKHPCDDWRHDPASCTERPTEPHSAPETVPSSFTDSIEDLKRGRVVNMTVALTKDYVKQKPTGHERLTLD